MTEWPWYAQIVYVIALFGIGAVAYRVVSAVTGPFITEYFRAAMGEWAMTYPEAHALVREYIAIPIKNMGEMRGGKIDAAAYEMIERFSHTPGAMLGDGFYSRRRLYEWVHVHVATFLAEYEEERT